MSGIEIKVDTASFAREIEIARKRMGAIGTKVIPRVAAAAINKTADRTLTRSRRELANAKGLPQRIVGEKMQRFKATAQRLVARVWVGLKRGILVEELPGARYDFKRGALRAGRVSVKPFKATMPSGKSGLWVRRLPSVRSSVGRSESSPNLPIEKPTIRLQPEAGEILERVANEQARTFLPGEFRRLIDVALKRFEKTAR